MLTMAWDYVDVCRLSVYLILGQIAPFGQVHRKLVKTLSQSSSFQLLLIVVVVCWLFVGQHKCPISVNNLLPYFAWLFDQWEEDAVWLTVGKNLAKIQHHYHCHHFHHYVVIMIIIMSVIICRKNSNCHLMVLGLHFVCLDGRLNWHGQTDGLNVLALTNLWSKSIAIMFPFNKQNFQSILN